MPFSCRTNFLVDLFCSFPTDIIVLAIWPDSLGKLKYVFMYKFHFLRWRKLYNNEDSVSVFWNLKHQFFLSLFLSQAFFAFCRWLALIDVYICTKW